MEVLNKAVRCFLVAGLLSLPGGLCAQGARAILSAASKTLSPQTVSSLQRSVLTAAKRSDIRLSVARLDHGILLNCPAHLRPHSSAFLFQTQYQGHPEIWAATAGHTAQPGEDILLTFHNGKKAIPVMGELVQRGPDLLSDAALIRLNDPLPEDLQPFMLADVADVEGELTTWGYSHNKLYRVAGLHFEKDNTRFIRTDFPREQKRRSGLCGGPLVNAQGKVLGIHCGSTLDDKAFAASMRIIPYLLQAYHEGTADVPLQIGEWNLGTINIEERITQIACLSENGHTLNILEVYDQLHQSNILSLLEDPEVRYLKIALGSYSRDHRATFRYLIFDKQTRTHTFEPFKEQIPSYF